MTSATSSEEQLRAENAELRARLEEAEDTLRAIRSGEVEALVVETADGPQIFMLQGLDAESSHIRGEILAQVSDSVIAVDADWRVTYLNAAAERQYRVTADAVLGHKLSKIFTRHWPSPDAEAAMWNALREHGEWHGEIAQRLHDGRELHVESSLTLLRDASGADAGLVSVIRDITERKRSAAEDQRVSVLLDALLRTAPIGFCFLDQDLRYLRINKRLAEINGIPAEAHLGRHVSELVPSTVETIREVTNRILATGEAVLDHEFSGETPAAPGVTRFWNESWYPVRDGAGEILGFGGVVEDITERKRAEDALRESHQFTRRVLDSNLSSFVGVTTADGTVTYANRAPLEAAGIPASEVLGKKFWDCYWWNYSPEIQAQLRDACERAASGEIVRYDVPVRMAGDTRMWIDLQVAPLRDAEGRITNLIPSAMDITERKQAEAALRSSEMRYRRLFEAAMDGVLILDGQTGRITDANPYILEVLGRTHGEAHGRELWEIGVFADATASRAAMAELQERDYVRYDDLPLESKIGQRREVEVVANVYQEDGQRVIQCNIRDISERKQAEEKLRASELETKRARDYAEATLRTAPIPLLVLRADLRVNTANEAFYKNFQVASAETEGALIYDLGNRQWNSPKLRELLEEILPKNNFFNNFEITHEFETIGHRTMLLNARRMENEAGQPLQIVLAIEDITERKHAEEALSVAMVEIERASRAKDDFLAALSHELRTPLTPVLMTATALASDPSLPAGAREQLDMMRRNIELEARLIDDLLDLTRTIHGKLTIERISADIHELLLHTDEIIRSEGLGKRLSVVLKLDAAHHHALGDPARLQQVFWNLLRNAVKFTPDGGTITVSTRNDAAGKIIISVADDGIGIRAEVLSQIFNAFEQADTTGEHRYGGLGLGLAISSAIITAHGGEIKAESLGLGHGADFTVTLGSVPSPAATSQQTATSAQPARSLTLLVVEDHEATRTVLERLLTHSGHLVTTASTVHDALTTYQAAHFDAVISDLGLPDGSGIDLMAQIQSIRPVPAIALSGYGMEDDLQRSKEAGFFAHLVKPVKLDQLKQLLTQIQVRLGHHDNA